MTQGFRELKGNLNRNAHCWGLCIEKVMELGWIFSDSMYSAHARNFKESKEEFDITFALKVTRPAFVK